MSISYIFPSSWVWHFTKNFVANIFQKFESLDSHQFFSVLPSENSLFSFLSVSRSPTLGWTAKWNIFHVNVYASQMVYSMDKTIYAVSPANRQPKLRWNAVQNIFFPDWMERKCGLDRKNVKCKVNVIENGLESEEEETSNWVRRMRAGFFFWVNGKWIFIEWPFHQCQSTCHSY